MSFFSSIWSAITGAIGDALVLLEAGLEPVFGLHAWGWAIIALTLLVRLALLPLAIKQTRSMRGMQSIQPRVKEIQKKYKVDRDLLKKDPETYQRRKAEMNEKLMALYKEEGVNPASSCLPLVLQMPIFFALFRVLGTDGLPELKEATFYFFTQFVASDAVNSGLGATVKEASWPGYLLIVAMSATMFITQKQMMSRNTVEGPAATQQKIMMYVFPGFLAVISLNFPLAVVLYWVTTNIWQGAQQYFMFRSVAHEDPPTAKNGADASSDGPASPKGGGSAPKGDAKPVAKKPAPKKPAPKKTSPGKGGSGHLPKGRG